MRRVLVLVSTLVVLALTAFTGSAAAAPPVTPNEFVGACNMAASWPLLGPAQGVGVQPGGGMERAFIVTTDLVGNTNGDDGMGRAISVTGATGNC